MTVATITLDPAFRVGPVDRRLFGTFVEHMGRCVYGGIYEPGHPTADTEGFRQDVAELVRELGPSVVRYPGGNFVSGYRWEDGIGEKQDRPRRLDLAWKAIETNAVGVDEFAEWCRQVDLDPILAVNLGTRGAQEAVDLLEYCNHPEGTALSDLRRANGAKEPHDIRVWCLGNELDGPWQVGHKSAEEYGRLAAETARAMRMVDPSIELVACGSSHSQMATFASWEATTLEHCYDLVDYVSLHSYYDPLPTDVATFLASSVDLDRSIAAVVATADHVGARLKSRRKLRLSVDEWNVWQQSRFPGQDALSYGDGPALIEDVYDVADAVVVGSLLITLLRHADRVGIACQAQLVNVIAPILTREGGPAWRQSIFHPFAQATRWARGQVLRVEPVVARYSTERYG
ncbi:MAG: alpha-L-arabinofuranosidase, partial [Actinomycetota bacterium]|nr:alpha-L-arabinofuranosidase [Actinomycetota bacterium]